MAPPLEQLLEGEALQHYQHWLVVGDLCSLVSFKVDFESEVLARPAAVEEVDLPEHSLALTRFGCGRVSAAVAVSQKPSEGVVPYKEFLMGGVEIPHQDVVPLLCPCRAEPVADVICGCP